MRHAARFACAIALAPSLAAQAAPQDSTIAIGTRHTLSSRILGEDRPYLVYQPAGPAGVRRPVLVLLDGDGHFHHTTGVVQFLADQGRMPPAYVVAVPNTADRTHDLTPATRDTGFATAGGADRMAQFLTDELLPEIERRYATAPFRVLIGHSFGGLFAANLWLTRPDAFQAYISISPSLWWDRERLTDSLAARMARAAAPAPWFYATMGGLEPADRMVAPFRRAEQVVRDGAPTMASVRFVLLPDDDHGSTPHRSTYDGLEAIFRQYRVPLDSFVALGIAGIDRRYGEVKARYGIPDGTPEVALNILGYQLLGDSAMARRTQALDVFRTNVRRFPRSANPYDSLGDAYRALGQGEAALACFAAAVHTAQAHPREGTVVPSETIAPVSQGKMDEVARELGRTAWDPAAIPPAVVDQCLAGGAAR